ncbi:nuclear autoantigenic sperm protein [Aplochiton taeniatus]
MPEETATASGSCMDDKPCSSKATDNSDIMEEAKKLIGTGKRHLVMGDVVSAVNVFQEACGLLAERYGDTADECGEAFFLCGKALLELARMENTVLGDALEGVPEESSEEGEKPDNSKIESADNLDDQTRDELRMKVYEAMAEKKAADGAKMEEKGATEDKEDAKMEEKGATEDKEAAKMEDKGATEDKEAAKMEDKRATEDKEAAKMEDKRATEDKEAAKMEDKRATEDKEDAKMEDKRATEDKESEEDVGNLQLAWEMLEVSKVIYKRKESKEDQLMAAQAYLKLGEVGAESGNYAQSLDDFQDCLALQLKYLPPHSRLLAETHYQLGMTLCYTDQYNQAIQHYQSSIKVIESRLAMLQEVLVKAEGEDSAKEERSEMEELKQLLPDIAEKVEDAKESQRTASSASQAIQQTLGGASTSSAFSSENGGPSSSSASLIPVRPSEGASSSKSPSDISHLVRKKRKPEEESPKKEADAKKAKQETTVNGGGDSASNGVQTKGSQEASDRLNIFSVGQGASVGAKELSTQRPQLLYGNTWTHGEK